jgi:hypothetical protein
MSNELSDGMVRFPSLKARDSNQADATRQRDVRYHFFIDDARMREGWRDA